MTFLVRFCVFFIILWLAGFIFGAVGFMVAFTLCLIGIVADGEWR